MLESAVIISVLIMVILSLFRVNVLFAILIAGLSAGVIAGESLIDTLDILISGMTGQANTALSYILLGIFAVMIGLSGITKMLVSRILSALSGKKKLLLFLIAGIACLSQNAIPVHIAFIPILIPPLLVMFDRMKLDRRAVAVALTFGLKAPYMTIPIGFGLLFQGIIQKEMAANGLNVSITEVTLSMIIPGIGMVVGLLIAIFFSYRKDRVVSAIDVKPEHPREDAVTTEVGHPPFRLAHFMTIVAIVAALGLQVWTKSLILGALAGIIILFLTGVVHVKFGDQVVQDGIGMMGMIAFIMLIASGYATVLKETGAVDALVGKATGLLGTSQFVIAVVMLLVGLIITMGIGSSFGTIPILAALYVPLCIAAGFSPLATAALIGTAGALGDAGSPASDSTLGPTSGLNADGKHHHIWDTCVPTFLHFNIPLLIFGTIAALVL